MRDNDQYVNYPLPLRCSGARQGGMGQKRQDAQDYYEDWKAANAIVDRMQRAAFKLDKTQADRNLSRKLTPPEHAGAYIFRAIDVLIKAGLSFDEITERIEGMTRISLDVRGDQLKKADEDLSRIKA